MIDKTLVRQRFKKNLKTYNEHSIVQKQMAEYLHSLIDFEPVSILELGCGTGILTEKLCKKQKFEIYDAIDIVDDCKNYIHTISNKINFIQADIENVELKQKYDLIISNAVFQWVEDLPALIEKLKQHLTPNGKIIFSTFGPKNYIEIKNITGYGLDYNTTDEIKTLINPQFIKEELLQLSFDTPIEVLKHLKQTGVNSLTTQHWTKTNLKQFEQKYKKYSPEIVLTYHPIYVIV